MNGNIPDFVPTDDAVDTIPNQPVIHETYTEDSFQQHPFPCPKCGEGMSETAFCAGRATMRCFDCKHSENVDAAKVRPKGEAPETMQDRIIRSWAEELAKKGFFQFGKKP